MTAAVVRPVDDVDAVPVLTRAERELLTRVHRWARQPLPSPYGYLPRWERELAMPRGCWQRNATEAQPETCTVWWGPANRGKLRVQIHAHRYGEQLLDVEFEPRTVREAVDVLVALGVLPADLSSAYRAGYLGALRRRKGTGLAGGLTASHVWTPPADNDRPLPRLLGLTPIPDPALRQGDR